MLRIDLPVMDDVTSLMSSLIVPDSILAVDILAIADGKVV